MLGLMVRPILEATVVIDQMFLKNYRVPPLYMCGVRYRPEPDTGVEEFATIPVVLERKWGDCDDLACWRVAELREQGEKAKIRITWKRQPSGLWLYHVVVRRGNGSVEDPSAKLGMP